MHTRLSVLTPAAQEPVSLAETKAYLRIFHDHDDDLLTGLITAAREWTEGYQARALLTTELRWIMADDPPVGSLPMLPIPLLALPIILSGPQMMNQPWELPRGKVQSIDSVKVVSKDGTEITVPSTSYTPDIDVEPARLQLDWGAIPRSIKHVQIDFTAGYGVNPSDVPQVTRIGIKALVAWLYENRGDTEGADMPKTAQRLLDLYRIHFA